MKNKLLISLATFAVLSSYAPFTIVNATTDGTASTDAVAQKSTSNQTENGSTSASSTIATTTNTTSSVDIPQKSNNSQEGRGTTKSSSTDGVDTSSTKDTKNPAGSEEIAKSSVDSSDKEPNKDSKTKGLTSRATTSGTWDGHQWSFDDSTGIFTLGSPGDSNSVTLDYRSKSCPWGDNNSIDNEQIKKIVISEKITANPDGLFGLLENLQSIEGLDKLNFDLSGIFGSGARGMFLGDKSLKSVDLSNPGFSNVTDVLHMFYDCSSLESVDLSAFTGLTNGDFTLDMFKGATSLRKLTLPYQLKLDPNMNLQVPNNGDKWYVKEPDSGQYYYDPDIPTMPNMYLSTSDLVDFSYYGALDPKYKTFVASDLWGEAPYDIDDLTGTLTIGAGKLGGAIAFPGHYNSTIKKIVFDNDGSTLPEDCSYLFQDESNLEEIVGLDKLDSSNVKNMYNMFLGTKKLKSVDLSSWNVRNVTDMSGMFSGSGLEKIDITGWQTSSLTNTHQMFLNATQLKSVDLSSWNVRNVTDMRAMFSGSGLEKIDITGWQTSSLTNTFQMFLNATQLKSIDASNLDVSKVTNMASMFENCTSLTSLDLSNFDTSKVVNTGLSSLVEGTNLQELKLGDKSPFNGNTDAKLGAAVSKNGGVTSGNWTKDDGTSKAYSPTDFMINYGTGDLTAGTYVAAGKLKWGEAYWDFDNSTGTLNVDPGDLGTTKESPWNRTDSNRIDPSAIKVINFKGKNKLPANSSQLFGGGEADNAGGILEILNPDGSVTIPTTALTNLEKIEGLDNLDTSQVTLMRGMFLGDTQLNSLDLSSWDVRQVTDIYKMFLSDEKLQSLNLKGWATDSLQNMRLMLSGTKNLKTVDFSSINTSKVTDISKMFEHSGIENANLTNFDTSQVTAMDSVFRDCTSLTNLDLSSFDTSKVTTMGTMFEKTKLQEIKLGDKFKFVNASNPGLGAAVSKNGAATSGNWIKYDEINKTYADKAYTAAEFMKNYGTADLTAGTYVADTYGKIIFNADPSTSKIGENGTATFTISGDSAANGSLNVSGARDISLQLTSSKGNSLEEFWKVGQEADLEILDSTGKTVSTQKVTVDDQNKLTLPDFNVSSGNEYRLTITGVNQNNTIAKDNIGAEITYNAGNESLAVNDFHTITSGDFKFNSVPSELKFKTEKLKISNAAWLVDREDDNWSFDVTDLRGTNADASGNIDRKDWNVVATAAPFEDKSGNKVDKSILAVGFVENGQTTELDETNEVPIYTHSVKGEKPMDHQKAEIKWAKDSGLKAVVHKSSELATDSTYTANVNLELRNEP